MFKCSFHKLRSIAAVLLLLLVQSVWAQQEKPVHLILPDQIQLEAGLNSIDLQLINSSEKDFTGELRLQLPQGLRALGWEKTVYSPASTGPGAGAVKGANDRCSTLGSSGANG